MIGDPESGRYSSRQVCALKRALTLEGIHACHVRSLSTQYYSCPPSPPFSSPAIFPFTLFLLPQIPASFCFPPFLSIPRRDVRWSTRRDQYLEKSKLSILRGRSIVSSRNLAPANLHRGTWLIHSVAHIIPASVSSAAVSQEVVRDGWISYWGGVDWEKETT